VLSVRRFPLMAIEEIGASDLSPEVSPVLLGDVALAHELTVERSQLKRLMGQGIPFDRDSDAVGVPAILGGVARKPLTQPARPGEKVNYSKMA